MKCQETYAQLGYSQQFIDQFESFSIKNVSEMFCPDLTGIGNAIGLSGDPWYYDYGENLILHVAPCSVVAEALQDPS